MTEEDTKSLDIIAIKDLLTLHTMTLMDVVRIINKLSEDIDFIKNDIDRANMVQSMNSNIINVIKSTDALLGIDHEQS